MYLLVGYEQSTLPPDRAALAWIAGQLLDALDSAQVRVGADGEYEADIVELGGKILAV